MNQNTISYPKSFREFYDMLWNDPIAQDYPPEMRKKLVQINITSKCLEEIKELEEKSFGKALTHSSKLSWIDRYDRTREFEEIEHHIQEYAYRQRWSWQEYIVCYEEFRYFILFGDF